jgi:hypothetical protein
MDILIRNSSALFVAQAFSLVRKCGLKVRTTKKSGPINPRFSRKDVQPAAIWAVDFEWRPLDLNGKYANYPSPDFSGWHRGEPLADTDAEALTKGRDGKVKGRHGKRSLSGEMACSGGGG